MKVRKAASYSWLARDGCFNVNSASSSLSSAKFLEVPLICFPYFSAIQRRVVYLQDDKDCKDEMSDFVISIFDLFTWVAGSKVYRQSLKESLPELIQSSIGSLCHSTPKSFAESLGLPSYLTVHACWYFRCRWWWSVLHDACGSGLDHA